MGAGIVLFCPVCDHDETWKTQGPLINATVLFLFRFPKILLRNLILFSGQNFPHWVLALN